MKLSKLEKKKIELNEYIGTLTTIEELDKVNVVLEFVLTATSEERADLVKMTKSDNFKPEDMLSFMIEKINAHSKEEVAV